MEYPEGELLLGGTQLYKPPSKDELVAKVAKTDKMLTYVAPVATLIHPVAGLLLQAAKGKTTEFLAEKKHEALTKSISEIKADTAEITKAVSEVKMDSETIKQEIQDIRDKPVISKQIIKNKTTINVVNAIDFITTKDDSKDDYLQRQQDFSRIQNSLSQLSTVAMLNNYNDLAQVLNVSNNLVGIAQGFETLQMASTLGTLSMSTFTGGLCMVTAGFGLCQSIFGKKNNGIGKALNGLASMIIEGFQHVIRNIHALQERMEYRFDRIEHLMERHHYQTITMLFELSRQTNGLHNLIMHGQEIHTKQVHSIRYDIKQVSLNLQSCSAMIKNNINAFREEKLVDILREIDYFISTDNITIDQVHQYFAKLMACFETVAMNSNLTGMALLSPSSSIDIQIKALQDALATNLYSVINVFTGLTKVGHLEILKVLDIYTKQLISIIPTPTEYHDEFSAKVTAEIDKIKTVTFSNPFSTKNAEVLVTQNWTHKKREIDSKVNDWFSNKVTIILANIRDVTANVVYDDDYIILKLKSHGISHCSTNYVRDLLTEKMSISDTWNIYSLQSVKEFLVTKYKSNNHLIIDLVFNGYSLEYIRQISQIDDLLARYGIYKQIEFTQRYQQYRDIGIIIKLKFCIGFDETIQIYEHLVDVISEKQETIIHKVIRQKYAEHEDLKRYKPIDVLKDAIFGYIKAKTLGNTKITIKCIDDFHYNNYGTNCGGDIANVVRFTGKMVIPKVEEFKTKTTDFFKLHDDKYKEAVRQNELHTIAEQVLVKLIAKQTE